MKLFLTGISGLLGLNFALQAKDMFEVSGCFHSHPVKLVGVEQLRLNLNSHPDIVKMIDTIKPEVIVHTAALTNVDYCETNFGSAKQINVDLSRRLARIAFEQGIRFIHISTDQLFDGDKHWYSESDSPNPLNNYGLTKLMAENDVLKNNPEALIIRTNFYGWGTSIRTSFSDWILSELIADREIKMFVDVYFSPILINHLVTAAMELLRSEVSGVFHVAGSDRVNKYEFALKIAQMFDLPTGKIRPISVDQFNFEAKRPKNMALRSDKVAALTGIKVPDVSEGINRLLELQHIGWPRLLNAAVL